jgi:phosphomannomutase
MPKAVIFDLDNTLAEPFRPPNPEVFAKFTALLARTPVAIMSAASLERITRDVLPGLRGAPLEKLTLFTANAAQCFTYTAGAWKAAYRYGFSPAELAVIKAALEKAVKECGLDGGKSYGQQFVDYEGYVAFTALGVEAPKEERMHWDPDTTKRRLLREVLMRRLPQFDVYIGGSTSVDVTPKGINKEFGVRWYAKYLQAEPAELLYVGDALYDGGNDAVVIPTGIQTRPVSSPSETERVIEELLRL